MFDFICDKINDEFAEDIHWFKRTEHGTYIFMVSNKRVMNPILRQMKRSEFKHLLIHHKEFRHFFIASCNDYYSRWKQVHQSYGYMFTLTPCEDATILFVPCIDTTFALTLCDSDAYIIKHELMIQIAYTL